MNSIFIIKPYKFAGAWVFDDPTRGLEKEPFVAGADRIIDRLVDSIPNAETGFRLLFSANAFPGYQLKAEWSREEYGGNWYNSRDLSIEGWLCPALFKYFLTAPKEIFVKAEPVMKD